VIIKQYLDIEYTNESGKLCTEKFEETSNMDYLDSITQKLAFIAECHLTDSKADFSKPITIKYYL
jgi:hypothetical protein